MRKPARRRADPGIAPTGTGARTRKSRRSTAGDIAPARTGRIEQFTVAEAVQVAALAQLEAVEDILAQSEPSQRLTALEGLLARISPDGIGTLCDALLRKIGGAGAGATQVAVLIVDTRRTPTGRHPRVCGGNIRWLRSFFSILRPPRPDAPVAS